ncbi:DUF3006 domain-containing protein [Paenibacillus sanfengchensis]|uniref:DUF3006 domain-containing protein n=1 Tax=Paenibacillus sanfengchensis TaxID=3119819 RepID=UPI002FE08CEE
MRLTEKTEDILKSELPAEVKAGDSLIFQKNKITIDNEDTKSRKEEISELMEELFED